MRTGRRAGVAIAVIMVFGFGIAGYFLGKNEAPTHREGHAAQRAAYARAYDLEHRVATRSALRRGYEDGFQTGRRDGDDLGRHEGVRAARAEARHRDAQAAAEEAEASAAEAAPAAQTATTECGVGQYNYNGYGCVPLDCPGDGCAHPPTPPATPESCPPGTVPVGVTGACGSPKVMPTSAKPDSVMRAVR